jgi:SAM-dependent methyltransferase
VEHGVPILLTEESRRILAAGQVPPEPAIAPVWFSGRWAERIRAWGSTGFGRDRRQESRLAAFVKDARKDALVVDLGSGSRRLADHVLTVDVGPFPGVDVVGDGHRLPFRDGSVERIVCTGVLEHVNFPERVVGEMVRVLCPGGRTYVSVPFMQGFHPASGTEQDFQRYTHVGLAQLLSPFRIIECGISGGPSAGLAWILREYIALPFAWSRLLYAIAYRGAGLLTFWIHWLDAALDRCPQAHRIACGFYAIGEKPPAMAGGAIRP